MNMIGKLTTAAIVLGLAFTSHAEVVAAQGKAPGNQRDRPQIERDRDRGAVEVRAGDARRTASPAGNGSGKVPPGWCQGVGNPHNTPENCGRSARVGDRFPYEDDRRYDDRGGSYEDAHRRFHRELDDYYNRLAAERPLDVAYQLELRLRKRAEHDEWHRRMGVNH